MKDVHFVDPIRITPKEFHAMRKAEKPDNLPAPPETLCKVLINGRWHACDRQYSFGQPTHYARPIVIVLRRPDPSGEASKGEGRVSRPPVPFD